jgi:hypothetical protein
VVVDFRVTFYSKGVESFNRSGVRSSLYGALGGEWGFLYGEKLENPV